MDTFISNSPEETQSLGRKWAPELRAGTVIGLSGDLGAGKTQLVKGLAAGLGIDDQISSPTFGLVNEYDSGSLPLFHIDLYRLDTQEQILGAGLETYLINPPGITVVEWIDRWITASDSKPIFSKLFRQVWIDSSTETERHIRYEDSGN